MELGVHAWRLVAGLLLLAVVMIVPVSHADAYPRIDKTEVLMFGDNPDPLAPGDSSGVGTLDREACVTNGYPPSSDPGGVPGVDKDISCDDSFPPDNEMAIVAHPRDPKILLGGSNDYQLFLNGNTVVQRVPAGYFLSLDGGATWIDGQVPMQASFGAGDPAPAFDVKRNRALMASLSFVCGQGAPLCTRGNLAVATLDLDKARAELQRHSENPQLPWQDQMVVNGDGSDIAAVQIFSDKLWLTVDNNQTIPTPDPNDGDEMMPNPNFGNYYLVYARFRSEKGAYDESPIYFTKSEDGGARWTDPVEISGRSTTKCTFQDDSDDTADRTGDFNPSGRSETPDDPQACDQDQFPYPVVAPDGSLYVHFHNEQNSQAYELPQRYDSQVMIVKSDDGGDTFYGDLTPAEQVGCVPQPDAAPGTPVEVQDFDPDTPGNQPKTSSCIVPIHVVDMEDSYDTHEEESTPPGATAIPDYPINVEGRTTLTNMQFRVNSAGTITVAPQENGSPSAYRLYVVYADNCAGVRPAPGQTNPPPSEDPNTPPAFVPVTDTNLYYAYSDDRGKTWVGGDGRENGKPYNSCGAPGSFPASERLLMKPGPDTAATGTYPDDQWFPWIDSNPVGGLTAAATMDGNAHDGFPARETYGYSLWTGGTAIGIPDFESGGNLSGAPSQPRQSRFFRTATVDPENSCPDCTRFIGDYNGIAVDKEGNIHGVWTDMRRTVETVDRPIDCDSDPATPAPVCTPVGLKAQDAYYAQRPVTPVGSTFGR